MIRSVERILLAQQVNRIDVDALGDPLHGTKRQVALTALEPTHVRPVHANDVRERLLGQALRPAQGAEVPANGSLQIALHLGR